jgi:hypothetical protein
MWRRARRRFCVRRWAATPGDHLGYKARFADAIATLDHRHFSVVRSGHLPAFKLLPEGSD